MCARLPRRICRLPELSRQIQPGHAALTSVCKFASQNCLSEKDATGAPAAASWSLALGPQPQARPAVNGPGAAFGPLPKVLVDSLSRFLFGGNLPTQITVCKCRQGTLPTPAPGGGPHVSRVRLTGPPPSLPPHLILLPNSKPTPLLHNAWALLLSLTDEANSQRSHTLRHPQRKVRASLCLVRRGAVESGWVGCRWPTSVHRPSSTLVSLAPWALDVNVKTYLNGHRGGISGTPVSTTLLRSLSLLSLESTSAGRYAEPRLCWLWCWSLTACFWTTVENFAALSALPKRSSEDGGREVRGLAASPSRGNPTDDWLSWPVALVSRAPLRPTASQTALTKTHWCLLLRRFGFSPARSPVFSPPRRKLGQDVHVDHDGALDQVRVLGAVGDAQAHVQERQQGNMQAYGAIRARMGRVLRTTSVSSPPPIQVGRYTMMMPSSLRRRWSPHAAWKGLD